MVLWSLPSREAWIEICISELSEITSGSLPSREAWIEIPTCSKIPTSYWSLPSREAWIEILISVYSSCISLTSLPSREAWIEIFGLWSVVLAIVRRFPRGKRGLKSNGYGVSVWSQSVASLAGSVD